MTDKLKNLREIAEAATRGRMYIVNDNGTLMATFSPDVATALVDVALAVGEFRRVRYLTINQPIDDALAKLKAVLG